MIKIYADGADLKVISEMNKDSFIKGFTTNPSILKKFGVADYEGFAKEVLQEVTEKPVSFEVFADSYDEMKRQALKIAGWGKNVYVKIPVTNTLQIPNYRLMSELSEMGVKVNATAITTYEQIGACISSLNTDTPSIISIFAGRIADTGLDPKPFMSYALLKKHMRQEILWASCREVYNIAQASIIKADIITVPNDILKKMNDMANKDLKQLSLETVQMFFRDAESSGYTL